jgi:hypothetical protein
MKERWIMANTVNHIKELQLRIFTDYENTDNLYFTFCIHFNIMIMSGNGLKPPKISIFFISGPLSSPASYRIPMPTTSLKTAWN